MTQRERLIERYRQMLSNVRKFWNANIMALGFGETEEEFYATKANIAVVLSGGLFDE